MRLTKEIELFDSRIKKEDAGKKIDAKNVVNIKESQKKSINEKNIKRNYKLYSKRYLACVYSFSPVVEMNNRGVDYVLDGKLSQAEVFFKEVLKEKKNFSAAYNNLGVIYEIMGFQKLAMKMYSKACLLEPENKFYERNFLLNGNSKKSKY